MGFHYVKIYWKKWFVKHQCSIRRNLSSCDLTCVESLDWARICSICRAYGLTLCFAQVPTNPEFVWQVGLKVVDLYLSLDRLNIFIPFDRPPTNSGFARLVGIWLLVGPRLVGQGWTDWILFQHSVTPPIGPVFLRPVGLLWTLALQLFCMLTCKSFLHTPLFLPRIL